MTKPMNKALLPLLLVGLALLLAACASAVPHPGERELAAARTKDPCVELSFLEHGRTRFVQRCSGCHAVPEPASLSVDEWLRALEDMGPKAKLSADDRRAVELYVVSVAGTVKRP